MPRKKKDTAAPASNESARPERWEVPSGWVWVKVCDAGGIKLGRQLVAAKRRGTTSTPYLRAANVTTDGLDLSDVYRMDLTERERQTLALNKGDLVLAEASGSPAQVGRSAIWNGEIPGCCLQNTVIRFRPHAVTSEFAHVVFRYFLAAGVFARASHGVGIQHLGASRFAQIELPIPGLAEQARIVAETQRRLEHAEAASAALKSALQGIDQQTSAVIEMAATGQAERPGDAPNVEQLRIRPETDLFELSTVTIPSSWRWSLMSEIGTTKKGKDREPRHEQGEHVVPYLRVANVFEDRIDTTDVLSMNFTPSEQEVFRLRVGDVLLNEGQSPELVGRPAIYRGDPPFVCFQNTLLRFRPGEMVDAEFALLVFRFYMRRGIFRSIAKWSTNIAHLSLKRFQQLYFPLPLIEEQRRLASFARERLAQLAEQRATAVASKSGIEEMRREILASAIRGNLSSRAPSEETATEMLARIGLPPNEPKSSNVASIARNASEADERTEDEEYRGLVATLNENDGRMAAEDLFAAAGYDRDLTREVENFYLSLREQEGKTIRLSGTEGGRTFLEVVTHETR